MIRLPAWIRNHKAAQIEDFCLRRAIRRRKGRMRHVYVSGRRRTQCSTPYVAHAHAHSLSHSTNSILGCVRISESCITRPATTNMQG